MKEEEHRDLRGVKRKNRKKRSFHGPMDYARTLKLRFRVGDLDLPERRKRGPVVGRRRKMHRCALVAKQ